MPFLERCMKKEVVEFDENIDLEEEQTITLTGTNHQEIILPYYGAGIGTKDWTKYEIKLPLHPDKTEKIYVGGLLIGKGKMWLDDLKVTIDGKEIQNLNS